MPKSYEISFENLTGKSPEQFEKELAQREEGSKIEEENRKKRLETTKEENINSEDELIQFFNDLLEAEQITDENEKFIFERLNQIGTDKSVVFAVNLAARFNSSLLDKRVTSLFEKNKTLAFE